MKEREVWIATGILAMRSSIKEWQRAKESVKGMKFKLFKG